MRIFIVFISIILSHSVFSQSMQIGIFNTKNVRSYTISIRQGKYLLVCDNQVYGEYKKNNIFMINKVEDKIEVRDKNSLVGRFSEVRLKNSDDACILSAKGVDPIINSTEYEDGLIFKVEGEKLLAINSIDLEKYIAGVIEAEGGIEAPLEYYKAQAVLVRTYTIKSIYKHAEEGFNLCDGVHCQAYSGRSIRNPEIYEATKSTAGEVLIDSDSILVMSPFHSSCGGYTSSSGIYWQTDLEYLVGVMDPFCNTSRNSTWEESVSFAQWAAFLNNNGVKKPNVNLPYKADSRKKFFIEDKVTFRKIREQFKLKSSFISIEKKENTIIFHGKGYGHGIGMCQLGAMEMARVGYTYIDIIHFYFHKVFVTDYRDMELHRY